ncbi:MAG: Na-translocating system protein MpsC family protein [Solirubrobacteraceae bacterium]
MNYETHDRSDTAQSAQHEDTTRLSGGSLLAAISTSIVKLVREHYGRGPIKAKTYALDDIIVCVMRGSGFTPLEKTMMESGDTNRSERVVAMREDFQRMMSERYKDTIEQLTGRTVMAFLSQAHVKPDITLEVFFIDRPLDGFGAVKVTDGDALLP